MPEQLTPAEELLDAAQIVREYAEKAGTGPWDVPGIGDFGWSVIGPCQPGDPRPFTGVETADSEQGKADARWIAMFSPLITEPLAALFEREAKVIPRRHPSDDNPALNLARVIRQQHQAMQGGEG